MKKLYIAPIMTILLVTSVLALTTIISIRGSGGNVDFIEGDSEFEYTNIKFSAWSNGPGVADGRGGLSVRATDLSGKRITLNLKLWQMEVLEDSADTFTVLNRGMGHYYTKGTSGPKYVYIWNLTYSYNRSSGEIDIVSGPSPYGVNDIEFEISGIDGRALKDYKKF